MKQKIKIKIQNGLDFATFKREVLDVNLVTEEFDFVKSESPDFIVFGPYGNHIPPKGDYVRIGYFCENITPDFNSCEWAFGIPSENKICRSNYKRIQWHGINPIELIKNPERNLDEIIGSKNRFCNFIYSTPITYREEFFRQLSKYKKIDAPGKSMHNMAWPNNNNTTYKWAVKRQFLSQYKFTISFENYVYPGYQTEKLYDPMLADSVPIYCGDPLVNNIFNTDSFLNASSYLPLKHNQLINWLENNGQRNFVDIRPQFFKNPIHRINRKVKSIERDLKMMLQFNNLDFSNLIDRIIELDKNDDLYLKYQMQPWLNANVLDEINETKKFWSEIFSG